MFRTPTLKDTIRIDYCCSGADLKSTVFYCLFLVISIFITASVVTIYCYHILYKAIMVCYV